MKTDTEGVQQCYNAQMAVDAEHQLFVTSDVGVQATDQGQMMALPDEVQHTVWTPVRRISGQCVQLHHG